MRANKLVLKNGGIQEMSAEQVEELVGKDRYGSLKKIDPHPFFAELLVAHEGVSRGKMLGAGLNRPAEKFWSKDRIRELVSRINTGPVPVYLFHNADNRSRSKVGEVIASYWRKVKGAFSALALIYISDRKVREMIKQGELDICSLEAELVFEKRESPKGVAEWVVNAIDRVSGLALGSRDSARPGFAGAAVLAQVEEFEDDLNGPIPELEKKLSEKEQELSRLRTELERYQSEREKQERKRRVEELVDRVLKDRSLKQEEQKHLLREVSERMELKNPASPHLEQEVKKETELLLARLAELKRVYQKPTEIRAPLEPEKAESGNPLIPREE